MTISRFLLLWRGGWQLRSPGGILGTGSTWWGTDGTPVHQWWIVGPVEVRWVTSGQPPDEDLYEAQQVPSAPHGARRRAPKSKV